MMKLKSVTRMKARKYLMPMATMFAMMLMVVACTEKNIVEPEDPEDPTNPENPVNPKDWHTIPVSGGDITVDNFTISLPSGTFETETKVAVTKEKAGDICGENEVTNFYQITSPIITNKPITVKVASEELGDGYCLVIHAPSYLQSGEVLSFSDVYMKTTYTDGAYTATIPEQTKDSGDEVSEEDEKTISFSIGLVKAPIIGQAGTRGLFTCEPTPLQSGEVEGVKWVLYAEPSAQRSEKVWGVFTEDIHIAVGQYIETSLKTLLDMGFTLKNQNERVIPFYYKRFYKKWWKTAINTNEVNPDLYGGFEPNSKGDEYNIIGLGVDRFANDLVNFGHQSLKCTIIHELFHYFQYELDSRWQYNKAAGYYMDNRSILYEMASVWSEQFMNDGNLNATFLKEHLYANTELAKLGIGQEEVRFKDAVDKPLAEQGYTLGPWLYYIVKQIKAYNLKHENKHPVWELFELYRTNWVNGSHNAYYIIQEWLDSYADEKFLYDYLSWDDYYLKLWQGELVKDFHLSQLLFEEYNDKKYSIENRDSKTIHYENDCYSYGCCVNKFVLKDLLLDLSGKELVIGQDAPGLSSYLIWTSKESNFSKYDIYKRDQKTFAASSNDSIVISGKELEALRMRNDLFNHEFYVITTNTFSPTSLTSAYRLDKPKTSHVTVELRDIGSMLQIDEDTVYVKKDAAKVQVEVKTNCKDIQIQNYKQWVQASLSEAVPNSDTRTLTLDVTANPRILKRGADIILSSWEGGVFASDTLHVTQAATLPTDMVTCTVRFSSIEAHMKGSKELLIHTETNRWGGSSNDENYPENIDRIIYIIPDLLNKDLTGKCVFSNETLTIKNDSIDLRKDPSYDPSGTWTATSPAGQETSTTKYSNKHVGRFTLKIDLSKESYARLVACNVVVEGHLVQKTTGTWSTPRNPGPGFGLDSKADDYLKEDCRYTLYWTSGHEQEYEYDPYPYYNPWDDEAVVNSLNLGIGGFGPWATASSFYEKLETGEGIEYDIDGSPAWRDYGETREKEETELVPDYTGRGSIDISW